MLRAIQKRLKNKKGFTLIELIVVIAILGIIAGIAVPKFGGMQDRAKYKSDIATAAVIGKAAETYLVENNTDTVTLKTLIDNKYIDGETTSSDVTRPKPQYKQTTTKAFLLNVSSGEVTVTYDNAVAGSGGSGGTDATELYPTPDAMP